MDFLKKAFSFDPWDLGVEIVLVGVTLLVGIGLLGILKTTGALNNTFLDASLVALQSADYAIPLLLVIALFFGGATGYALSTKPYYLFFFIIVMLLTTVASALVSNFFYTIINSSSFLSGGLSSLPFLDMVISNLPKFLVIYSSGVAVIGFSRSV